jgi:hypothetical protein
LSFWSELPTTALTLSRLAPINLRQSKNTFRRANNPNNTMCIIRQLMNKHSIIDCYPRILDGEGSVSSVPGASESSVSSADDVSTVFSLPTEHSVQEKTRQDASIFEKIAEAMPPKSLFHLLRGASQATGKPTQMSLGTPEHSVLSTEGTTRRLRFATNSNGSVKCEVREIPRISDPSLWWQKEDMKSIRAGCASLAGHYRAYKPEYIEAISRLMECHSKSASAKRTAAHMECLSSNTISRGLEMHIVKRCGKVCRNHTQQVLDAQHESQELCEDYSVEGDERIRMASVGSSRRSLSLAAKLAQYDTCQAMAASLSAWDAPTPTVFVD